MKALPNEIYLGPHTYQVRIEPEQAEKQQYGEIRYMDSVIAIHPDMSDQCTEVTLFHEMFHHYFKQAGILKHNERILEVAAYAVVDMKQKNPELFK